MKHKKVINHKEKSKEPVRYVLLNSPNSLRKDVLLNALDMVKVVKDYDKYKQLKTQKIQLFSNIKSIMDDINDSFHLLHRKLPLDESLRGEILHKNTIIKHNTIAEIKKPKLEEFSEEARIRDELRLVENRLKRMGF